jgi:hypothetical protein
MGIRGIRRNITREEVCIAQKFSSSAVECSRFLGVSYQTYANAAKKYGLHDKLLNPSGKGITKFKKLKQNYEPDKIFATTSDIYLNPKLILLKLIKTGHRKNECEICGWKNPRIIDNKVPLILCFKDRNSRNYLNENLEVCCHNCEHNYYDMRGRYNRKNLNLIYGKIEIDKT